MGPPRSTTHGLPAFLDQARYDALRRNKLGQEDRDPSSHTFLLMIRPPSACKAGNPHRYAAKREAQRRPRQRTEMPSPSSERNQLVDVRGRCGLVSRGASCGDCVALAILAQVRGHLWRHAVGLLRWRCWAAKGCITDRLSVVRGKSGVSVSPAPSSRPCLGHTCQLMAVWSHPQNCLGKLPGRFL